MLTDQQTQLKKRLQEIASQEDNQIIYCKEWLGYFPYGAYHWIEYKGKDITDQISKDIPEWEGKDLLALEEVGFLKKVNEWQNPKDETERKITYRIYFESL